MTCFDFIFKFNYDFVYCMSISSFFPSVLFLKRSFFVLCFYRWQWILKMWRVVKSKSYCLEDETQNDQHILKPHSPFLSHTLYFTLRRSARTSLSYVWFTRVMELDSEALEKQQQQDGHTVQSLPATNQTTSSNFPKSTRWHFYVKVCFENDSSYMQFC